jgi:predicted ABC-class ATPase
MLTITMPFDTYKRILEWHEYIQLRSNDVFSARQSQIHLNEINFACEQLQELMRKGA